MTPHYVDEHATVFHGDCLNVLAELPDASIDAVVTDPPYGIGFMGHAWDQPGEYGALRSRGTPGPHLRRANVDHTTTTTRDGAMEAGRYDLSRAANARFQDWCEAWAAQCLRVLKAGGHFVSFGGARTWHRLAAGVEDAGFELRDNIAWLFGSGFPKSLDVAKAIDKAAGVEGTWRREDHPNRAGARTNPGTIIGQADHTRPDNPEGLRHVYEPTSHGQPWQGWGTALKPGYEPIVVARKPLAGSVARNVLEHGTGALNIDGCRIEVGDAAYAKNASGDRGHAGTRPLDERRDTDLSPGGGSAAAGGRWPANVVLSHSEGCEQVGTRQVRGITGGTGNHDGTVYGARSNAGQPVRDYADADGMETVAAWSCVPDCPVRELDRQAPNTGAAAPASGRTFTGGTDRTVAYGARAGMEGRAPSFHGDRGGASRFFPTFRYEAKAPSFERPRDGETAHPTVKPLDLMRWLVRLVTPPGGTVLDPFGGSGTTAEACVVEGFRCITIEREAAYLPLIVARLSKPIQGVLL
jgi:site-specific DNA-methyltransferase (adenine-specific)